MIFSNKKGRMKVGRTLRPINKRKNMKMIKLRITRARRI